MQDEVQIEVKGKRYCV